MSKLRHIVRKLARKPAFSTLTLVTLALGIGANIAVFSVVDGVLLEPLPFAEPDELVGIWHEAPGLGFDLVNQSPATYFTYRDESRAFTDVGLWDDAEVAVTGLEEPEQVEAMLLTDGILDIVGVQPVLGRDFNAEDDSPEGTETVILGHDYWQSRFSGDPQVLDQVLTIEGRSRTIIGVMPPGFRFLDRDPAVYLPFRFDRAEARMGNFSYQGLGRLRPGVTLEQANADVARMIPMAAEQFPGGISLSMLEEARFGPVVRPLKLDVIGDVSTALWVLLGTVGIVLLIACANAANLFLIRAEGRQQEVAVRTALGASRGAIVGDFIVESLVLAVSGGLFGLGLAALGLRLLLTIAPASLPRLSDIGIDANVLGFAAAVTLLTGLLLGLVPGLHHGKARLVMALKEGGRGRSDGKERQRARSVLVVCQIALALVLLVGSGLMVRSFTALQRVEPGFDRPEEVLTLRVAIPRAEIEDPAQVALAHERIFHALEEIPGVSSVGASSSVTMDGWDSNDALFVEDFPTPEGQLPPIRRFKWASPNYFETMGNPLLAGRGITWSDIHQRANVVVVTDNFARELWGSPTAALGKRVRNDIEGNGTWREIVGVVGDVRDDGLAEDAPKIIYWPMVVSNFWDEELHAHRSLVYAVRGQRVNESGFLGDVRQAVWSVNASLPLAKVRTLEEILERSMARTSFTLVMLGIAAGVALLLGIVGIYGVTSYAVAQRTREIGVRLALGARRTDIRHLVLSRAMLLAACGVVVGLGAAFALTRLMSTLLYGVDAMDPLTCVAMAATLVTVALVASYIPARRAARTDPMVALRWE